MMTSDKLFLVSSKNLIGKKMSRIEALMSNLMPISILFIFWDFFLKSAKNWTQLDIVHLYRAELHPFVTLCWIFHHLCQSKTIFLAPMYGYFFYLIQFSIFYINIWWIFKSFCYNWKSHPSSFIFFPLEVHSFTSCYFMSFHSQLEWLLQREIRVGVFLAVYNFFDAL